MKENYKTKKGRGHRKMSEENSQRGARGKKLKRAESNLGEICERSKEHRPHVALLHIP